MADLVTASGKFKFAAPAAGPAASLSAVTGQCPGAGGPSLAGPGCHCQWQCQFATGTGTVSPASHCQWPRQGVSTTVLVPLALPVSQSRCHWQCQ